MNVTVTMEGRSRPWWRPLGLRSLRRWYRQARRQRHGRLWALAFAFLLARLEFHISGKKVA